MKKFAPLLCVVASALIMVGGAQAKGSEGDHGCAPVHAVGHAVADELLNCDHEIDQAPPESADRRVHEAKWGGLTLRWFDGAGSRRD